jgi:hypothetical protein
MRRLIFILFALLWAIPSHAQWNGCRAGLCAPEVASAPPAVFSLTPTANATDLTAQTTYTFSSQSFGTADATRVIAVIILSRNSGGTQTVSNVSIGGVSASKAVGQLGSSNAMVGEIWYAAVPTGTSGTVSITFAGANQRCAIQLYSIIAPSSAAPTVTASSLANPATSGSITIPVGGAAIGGNYLVSGGPGTPTATPNSPSNGFNNLDLNNNIVGTQQVFSFHSNAGAITGSQTLTMSLAGGGNGAAVFAAWGP